MDIMLRSEQPANTFAVENLTRQAFWDVYKPGCDEHFVLRQLRKSESFVPELSIVALDGDQLVGHILLTRANVENNAGNHSEVLCLGPISVLPEKQRMGIGTQLMQHAIQVSKDMGFRGILLFGNPSYYGRFGFANAAAFGITTADGRNFDAFMALELSPESLKGISGKFLYDKAFEVDREEVARFDAQFPPREKHVLDSQIFKE